MTNQQINKISKLIYKHIVGFIQPDERQLLNEWIEADANNKEMFQKITSLYQLEQDIKFMNSVDTQKAMNDMMQRIERESFRELSATPSRRSKLVYRWMSAAAVVLLIVATSAVAYHMGIRHAIQTAQQTTEAQDSITHGHTQALLVLDNGETIKLGADEKKNQRVLSKIMQSAPSVETTDDSAPVPTLNLKVPRGGEFKITLEDGTEVWLNAESQLHYPKSFDSKERRVAVSGEAYFKVAKDESRPFYVETSGQVVRVYGTEFNINSYQESDNVYTTLVNGSIALCPVNGNGSELVLSPGHQAIFDKLEQSSTVRSVDTNSVTSWRHGKFVFENQTLEQIMITLSRWYDFNYEFVDMSLRSTIFMGSIPRYGEFNIVLSILEKSGGIRFQQKGNTIFINHK